MKQLTKIAFAALAIGAALWPSAYAQANDQSLKPERIVILGSAGQAQELLLPGAGQSFTLGDTAGAAYYTIEPNGFRLVTTLGTPEGTPVRFTTTLAPNQIATVSVPRGVGQAAIEVSFSRLGDRVLVATPLSASH